jgi:hypothetical protein
MPTITASVTPSLNVGVITYTWTINQTSGTAFAGVSTTTGASTATVTYPSTLTWSGAGATSGTYAYTLQCIATDSGVAGCNQVKTFILYFTLTPPACTLTLSNITVV